MKVLLLENTPNVGLKNEVKEVKNGFARNFLIPEGKAIYATDALVVESEKRLEARKEELAQKAESLQKALDDLSGKEIKIVARANDQGHLFAGYDAIELASIIKDQTGFDIEAEYLVLDRPVKETGEHIIDLKIGDKEGKVTVKVEAQE